MLRAPNEAGSVYTTGPVDDPTKARQVHRSMLKDVVGVDSLGCAHAHNSPTTEQLPSEDKCSFGYGLLVLGQQAPVVNVVAPSTILVATTQTDPKHQYHHVPQYLLDVAC